MRYWIKRPKIAPMKSLNPRGYYRSPIGWIRITVNQAGIVSINFVKKKSRPTSKGRPWLKKGIEEIDGYFKKKRKKFSLRFDQSGTPFQQRVWKKLLKIPYGVTCSYQDLAWAVGKKHAARAVGSAVSKNRIPIVIPCHRVIGSDGRLSGYASGAKKKAWLLRHEKAL